MNLEDAANRGGSCIVKNLAVTGDFSTTFKSIATKITDVTSPYEHTPLDAGDYYFYALTAENDGGESEPSEETYGIPIPTAPTNVVVTPDIEENNITWDTVDGADSYNLYWMIYNYFQELFPYPTDLTIDWDIYKDNGGETVSVDGSGYLYMDTRFLANPGARIIRKDSIPSGDFDIEISLISYHEGLYGPEATFSIYDTYSPGDDWAKIYYYTSSSGQKRVTTKFNVNGSLVVNTYTVPASRPTKFRITRVGNTVTSYYYISSWILHQSYDFSTRAANLLRVGVENNAILGADYIQWDNLLYWVDVKTLGTEIEDVTSPYEHSPLTPGENYNYVLTAENIGGEGDASDIASGVPLVGTPDAPTGISTEGGEGQNTITFTVDPEADDTHIYWSNSPGVTPGTGTKIASVSSPYIHDELNPSLTYYYVLTSENTYGEGDPSAEYNDSPIPEPPENVVVDPDIEKNVITWDVAFGADTYNIWWSYSPGVNKGTGTKIADVTSPHNHESLVPGVPIYYTVASEDEDGESSLSSEDSGIPELAAPTSPYAELTDALEITVTWDAVTGATRYNLYWSKTPGVTKGTGTKIADVSSPYEHTGLDDGDTYYYVITAENATDESEISSEVSAVVGDIPNAPLNVVASGTDIQEITISWSSVPDAESYNIYWSTLSGVNKIVGTKIEGVTSPHIFNAPIPDINYYFVVTAVDSITGESDESTEVSTLSIPPIPSIPVDALATPGEAKITLSFTNSSYADTYNIYWKDTPGVTKANGTKIADVTSPHDFTVPALYQTYYFVITAENESGESDDSAQVEGIPTPIIPEPPENVGGVASDSDELTITWDAAIYAATYNVYYARLPNVTKATATKISDVADIEKIITDLIAGRIYYFAISSVNPEGESALSQESSAKALRSLDGEQIFYIKAESQQNTVIVTWSDLEYAESYNIYWSKTTPVNINTANKIENVTSPYRHYRLSTDDPYYVVTGENSLGESDPSSEASAAPKDIEFQSINFLPENLQGEPLFQEFCNVLDYVVDKYHYENVDKLTGLYNAVHDDFDPDYVLKLIGADYFFEFDLTVDQKKTLCLLLSNLYDMKGTKKGLDYVLRLMGLEAEVYEWYNINQGLYPEIPETVDSCSIVIDLGLGDHSLLEDEEQKFMDLAGYLLWVCVKLHGIFWSKKFEDWFEGIEDELHTIELDNSVYDKYCAWRYNYPDVVIIGPPFEGNPIIIGESGLTIGADYFGGYPLVVSPVLDEGVDFDGVCDAHFIGEPDIYIGAGGAGEGLSKLTWVIEED